MNALSFIAHDLYRHGGREGVIAGLMAFAMIPGFRMTALLRLSKHFSERRDLVGRLIYFPIKAMQISCRHRFGFQIGEATELGPGFYLNHFGNVVVNPSARIGSDVNISHGVTIGQTNRGPRKGAPIIGDRVWIGPNAIVVGRINIGNDALIAPGAYVNFDVPSNAVVSGNPASVLSLRSSSGYVNNCSVERFARVSSCR